MSEYFHFSVGTLPSGNIYVARDTEAALMQARAFLQHAGYTEIIARKIPLTQASEALSACEEFVNKRLDGKNLADKLANLTTTAMPPRRMERRYLAS